MICFFNRKKVAAVTGQEALASVLSALSDAEIPYQIRLSGGMRMAEARQITSTNPMSAVYCVYVYRKDGERAAYTIRSSRR